MSCLKSYMLPQNGSFFTFSRYKLLRTETSRATMVTAVLLGYANFPCY